MLPPVFNQIQFDIYSFLTPGSKKAQRCQFRLGLVLGLDGSSDLTVRPGSHSVGSLGSISHITRGRLPSQEPKLLARALPWDQSQTWSRPSERKGACLCGYSQTSVLEAGFQAVSNTQFLPKWNENQHMQLKLPKSVLLIYLNKQLYLHWILSTFGLCVSKHSCICTNWLILEPH